MSLVSKLFKFSKLNKIKLINGSIRSIYRHNKYFNNNYVYRRNNIFRYKRKTLLNYFPSSAYFCSVPEKLNDIDSDDMIVNMTSTPKKIPNYDKLLFGKEFTDHMLEIDWNNETGWSRPIIKPYGPLLIDPAASCLHYALQAFEGMKAYIDKNDKIRLFRPKKNIERILKSCEALFFPQFDGEEFLECMYELIRLEKEWIPKRDGYSLYIRPTIIGTHPHIGVAPAQYVKLYCILSPVGPYFPRGFEPIHLYADTQHTRAWPGGAGCFKLGCNYGPTIKPQMKALAKGYDQILWLVNNKVTEVGTMNLFVYWINKNGEKELITAPLDGTILPGVTRDSILKLVNNWNEFKVSEKEFSISELLLAQNENRILEMFGAGTAAIVCPIKGIGYNDKHYSIPLDRDNPNETEAGTLTKRIYKTLTDIQYGVIDHPWSVVIQDKSIHKSTI